MKKIKLLSILIFSLIILVFSSSFVSAKTKDFYLPVNIESEGFFKEIIRELGLNNLFSPIKILASQMTLQGDIVGIRDGGGGAEDLSWSLDFPTDFVYVFNNISDVNFEERECPTGTDKSIGCFFPKIVKKSITPWRVKEVEVHTSGFDDDGNTPNCKTNAFITSSETTCNTAFNNNLRIYGSSNGFCRNTPLIAYTDEGNFSEEPAGRACGHVRLDGGALFDSTFWNGFLKATAISPEYKDFGIRGKDANSGQIKTIKNGGSLEICNGETIDVFWETKDVISTAIIFGEVDPSTCGGCLPGEPKNVSFSGLQKVKPLQSTNFSLVIRASTGNGLIFLSPDPVYVILRDCEEEPEIIHCDKLDDLDNGTNPFCVDQYPQYGSKKKCCNWPEDQGEFGDGCGKCDGVLPSLPAGELSVDLKVGTSDGPVNVDYGEEISLSWTSLNADYCSIFGPSGFIIEQGGILGDVLVKDITSDRTYTLRCYQGNQYEDDTIDLLVEVPIDEPYVDLKANNSNGPIVIDYNSSVNLTWTSQNVDDCVFPIGLYPGDPDIPKPNQGEELVSGIISDRVFTFTCLDDEGVAISDSVVVNIDTTPTQSYIDLKANNSDGPIVIDYNSSVNLIWTSQNVSNCIARGLWTGPKPENGQEMSGGIKNKGFFKINCKDIEGNNIKDEVPVVVTQSKGDIRVFIRLDGEIVEATDVSYNISGPESFSGLGQEVFNNTDTGTYTISYNEGFPPNLFDENIEFSSYSPARTLLLGNNQTITFYLDFETLATCNITTKAELASCGGSDFQPWSGVMTYSLLGPVNLNGTFAPQEFTDIPGGSYFLNVISGPGILNSIIPSNPINCAGGSSAEVIARFEDCDTGPGGYRYNCNLQSQRCEICTGSVDECPFATLSECRNNCGGVGGGCNEDIDVVCWTNFDSNNCIGITDGDTNPNIVLTNNLAGCSGISSCEWQVIEKPQYTQNSCAPFSWYDEPGKYTAKITAIIDGVSTTDIQEFEVRDVDGVECSFVWTPQSISANSPTDFFDNSISRQGTDVVSWFWTFTGANIATSTNQIVQNVIFSSPGNKEITISVENSAGDTCSSSQNINVRRVVPNWIEVIPE